MGAALVGEGDGEGADHVPGEEGEGESECAGVRVRMRVGVLKCIMDLIYITEFVRPLTAKDL